MLSLDSDGDGIEDMVTCGDGVGVCPGGYTLAFGDVKSWGSVSGKSRWVWVQESFGHRTGRDFETLSDSVCVFNGDAEQRGDMYWILLLTALCPYAASNLIQLRSASRSATAGTNVKASSTKKTFKTPIHPRTYVWPRVALCPHCPRTHTHTPYFKFILHPKFGHGPAPSIRQPFVIRQF